MSDQSVGTAMNKSVFLVALVLGIVLLVMGVTASDSISSDFSRLFTGQPTDKAIWLLISGAVITGFGLIGLARGSR